MSLIKIIWACYIKQKILLKRKSVKFFVCFKKTEETRKLGAVFVQTIVNYEFQSYFLEELSGMFCGIARNLLDFDRNVGNSKESIVVKCS